MALLVILVPLLIVVAFVLAVAGGGAFAATLIPVGILLVWAVGHFGPGDGDG